MAQEISNKASQAEAMSKETKSFIHQVKRITRRREGTRSNVYYEIGFAHKVNPNKVIIIGQEPFDKWF